jgi:hypothetical protein
VGKVEDEEKFFEKLVFNTASYLAPKSVITSFQTNKMDFEQTFSKYSQLSSYITN